MADLARCGLLASWLGGSALVSLVGLLVGLLAGLLGGLLVGLLAVWLSVWSSGVSKGSLGVSWGSLEGLQKFTDHLRDHLRVPRGGGPRILSKSALRGRFGYVNIGIGPLWVAHALIK